MQLQYDVVCFDLGGAGSVPRRVLASMQADAQPSATGARGSGVMRRAGKLVGGSAVLTATASLSQC